MEQQDTNETQLVLCLLQVWHTQLESTLSVKILACEQALIVGDTSKAVGEQSASEASRWEWEPARTLLFSKYSLSEGVKTLTTR